MRILIDIGHPGHVHYFKNLISFLQRNKHKVLIFAREREVIFELLNKLNLSFISRGKGRNSRLGKFFYILSTDFYLLKISLKFKPDLFLSFSSPYPAHISFLLSKPHIVLNDTEHADRNSSLVTFPFSDVIFTPSSYLNDLGKKQIRFNSVVESLYLHKKYFKPDLSVKNELGIKKGEEYIVLRFVSWNAHHDYGHSGLDIQSKRDLIEILKPKYKIFISSEGEMPEEFRKYQITISPEKMHDVLCFASLFVGESATMASESVILHTPAVYVNSLPLMGYLKLEQDFGLLRHFKSSEGVTDYVKELIKEPELSSLIRERSEQMQKNFIDPTKLLLWFIENYPQSNKILKENPDFQFKFK